MSLQMQPFWSDHMSFVAAWPPLVQPFRMFVEPRLAARRDCAKRTRQEGGSK
jgi:hypothetical protein